MGAVGVRSTSDMFSSLLSDTEEHFRQHRNSLSAHSDNQSAAIYVKPEVRINPTSSSSSSVSSERSEDETNPSLNLQMSKENISDNNECTAFSSDLSNSQLLMQQDQCCPGFTMSKSSKMRYQGNGCIIS